MHSLVNVERTWNIQRIIYNYSISLTWWLYKIIYRRTLDWDDLIMFKCFRVNFSLKKKTTQFLLSLNLYFRQKRALKLSICHLPTKRSLWVFDVTSRTNSFCNFQSYHEVVMNLFFNSLAKSCTLFWKYS